MQNQKRSIKSIILFGCLIGTGFSTYFSGCINTPPKKVSDFEVIEFKIRGSDVDPNPYKTSDKIEKIASENPDFGNQLAAWEYSYIGKYQKMLAAWDAQRKEVLPISDETLLDFNDKYVPENAVDHILNAAEKYNIIIINEAHQVPLHRVFTTSLLEGLYNRGYRYLGLETLASVNDVDPQLHDRKYPLLKTGYYSKEPQFGRLITKALEIGFILFDYEAEAGLNGKDREISQANNIFDFMQSNGGGKYLIHCGFAHAYEGLYSPWGKAMAQRLKDTTGIDPFTINQVKYTEKSRRSFEDPLYQRLDLAFSTIFVDTLGLSYNGNVSQSYGCDAYVFHPRTTWINNRPGWMFTEGSIPLTVNISDVTKSRPCLVMCYPSTGFIPSAVPFDIIEIGEGEDLGTVILEKGNFQIIIKNDSTTYAASVAL